MLTLFLQQVKQGNVAVTNEEVVRTVFAAVRFVGQFTAGYIWLYLNQGTNLNPVFIGGSKIESNGTPITTSYG